MRVSRKKKKPQAPVTRYFANEQIRSPQVRVIDSDGSNLEVMATADAIRIAQEKEMDLVIINPKAEPPVAKIIDLGNFKYQKEKERRKQRAQQKANEVKGVRLTPRMGEHDMDVRKKRAIKFLERGDKVQIEIIMRGRDRAHPDLMKERIKSFIDLVDQEMPIKTEQAISKQGSKFTALIAKKS